MNETSRRPLGRACLIVLFGLLVHLPPRGALGSQDLSLILTSNLEARFSLDEKDQDLTDPLLLLAQAVLNERRRSPVDLHLDLGNAFYPGLLSKYSSGSVVMDYLATLHCDAALVSSEDIQIGIEALRSLAKIKRPRLVSASIFRDAQPLFDPYVVYSKEGTSFAFVGVSSHKVRFDISEKYLYNVTIRTEPETLEPVLEEIERKGIAHIIVLSGLGLEETVGLLRTYPRIGMAICGGDNTGTLYSSQASRIELSDGRPLVLLPESDGFYRLDLAVDSSIAIKSLKKHSIGPPARGPSPPSEKTLGKAYFEFARRLALWKRKAAAEEARVLASPGESRYVIDDKKVALLLRDMFDAEVAVVREGTMRALVCSGEVTRSDISGAIHDDYSIFLYTLTGADLKKISSGKETLVVSGIEDHRVQGYPVEDSRTYRVASPQSAFEAVERLVGRPLSYKNTWTTVSDAIQKDLETGKALFRADYAYLERRLRTTVDIYLANFFDTARIRTRPATEPPPGWPAETYKRWGLENKADLTVYNRTHQIVFTPYLNYQRQDESFQQNLLRGTLLYNLNISEVIKPYEKSQVETVLERNQDGLRPVRVRQTVGVYVTKGVFSGKAGVGFEKQVYDPVGDFNLGAEALAQIRYPFHQYFTYTFGLDSFASADFIRSEIENVLSVTLNRYLGTSAKHKFWYYNPWSGRRNYINSQITLSLDLKVDFKFW